MSIENLYLDVNKNPSRRELATFGGGLLGLFLLAACVFWLVGGHALAARIACALGVVLALISIVPGVGRILYVFWMCLGITIGLVTTPIVLMLLFLTVFTPVAFVMRILRRDAMRRRFEPQGTSYWEDWKEPDDARLYFRQY